LSFVSLLISLFTGSNDYVNNYLQPFLADAQQYTHDDFVKLLMVTLTGQLKVYTIQESKLQSSLGEKNLV